MTKRNVKMVNLKGQRLANAGSNNQVFDLSKNKEELTIDVRNNDIANILLVNLKDDTNIKIDVGDNSTAKVSVLATESINKINITANVGKQSVLNAYFADFIPGKCKATVDVNLNKENSCCNWLLASLSMNEDNKEFDVSVHHNSVRTFAQIDSYGVCRDKGKLVFSGICHINKGCHGSKAHQNAKIMVFDEISNGIAKPILKIDDNDIEASHAAVVGKINDEHIFYLTSRGLSEDEAKRLITLGYLKPILKGFDDEKVRKQIEQMIEGEK